MADGCCGGHGAYLVYTLHDPDHALGWPFLKLIQH